MSATEETRWWSSLSGDEIERNTAGHPPYDVDAAARRITQSLRTDGLNKTYLDLGCGTGRLTNRVAAMLGDRVDVCGVDVAQPLIDAAAASAQPHVKNAAYWLGDGRQLPPGLPPRFRGGWSVTMFQHIPIDATYAYLNQIRDRLLPGSTFVFTVAVGDDPPTFLAHQIPDLEDFAMSVAWIFDSVEADPEPDENGWHWLVGHVDEATG